MPDKRIKFRDEKGFSLIELIVVITILGIVLGIAYGVILLNAKTFEVLSDSIVTRWDMRKAMDVLRNDIQELNAGNILGPTLTSHSGNKLYFKDMDGHQIRYRYTNNMLLRSGYAHHHGFGFGMIGGWNILLKNLSKPPFQFLDRDMHLTSDSNKLAYIKVTFIVKNNGKAPVYMENLFYLRNTAPLAP